MPVSEITIHECSFVSRPCENYTCGQAANKKKYFIGNPKGFSHKPIFCEDCIKHLAKNLPAEIVSGGVELEAALRASITKEYDTVLEQQVREAVKVAHKQWVLETMAVQVQAEAVAEPAKVDAPAEVKEEPNEKAIHRCLDCNKEFESAAGLRNHKRSHQGS